MYARKKHNWTPSQTEFIKSNWNKISIKDIASEMDCSTTTIRKMGKRLNLEPKYKDKGITTVESVKAYGERFKNGEHLKLQFKVGKKTKLFEGVVISKTDCLVTLQREHNIRGSFNYSDFINRDVKILEG